MGGVNDMKFEIRLLYGIGDYVIDVLIPKAVSDYEELSAGHLEHFPENS